MKYRLNQGKMCQKKRDATPVASISPVQGQKIAPFIRSWSTTTITEPNLEDRGSLEIRSTEIEEMEMVELTVRGVSLGIME